MHGETVKKTDWLAPRTSCCVEQYSAENYRKMEGLFMMHKYLLFIIWYILELSNKRILDCQYL